MDYLEIMAQELAERKARRNRKKRRDHFHVCPYCRAERLCRKAECNRTSGTAEPDGCRRRNRAPGA